MSALEEPGRPEAEASSKRLRVMCLSSFLADPTGPRIPGPAKQANLNQGIFHPTPNYPSDAGVFPQAKPNPPLAPFAPPLDFTGGGTWLGCGARPDPTGAAEGSSESGAPTPAQYLQLPIRNAYREWKAAGGSSLGADPGIDCDCLKTFYGISGGQGDEAARISPEHEAGVLLLTGDDREDSVWAPVIPLLKLQRLDAVPASLPADSSKALKKIEAEATSLTEKLGPTKPLHLVALGSGALPALTLAERRPDLVKKLVLTCPNMPSPWPADRPAHEAGSLQSGKEAGVPKLSHQRSQTQQVVHEMKNGKKWMMAVSQPTLCLSSADDSNQKTALILASRLDDCRFFDLGSRSFPTEGSETSNFMKILVDFLFEKCC